MCCCADTEDMYTLATKQIVCQYGKTYTWETKIKVMGLIGKDVAAAIIAELELPLTVDEYLVACLEVVRKLFPSCQLLPGQLECVYTACVSRVPTGRQSAG